MLKEPRAGRVKTRLGHDIGMTCAAWWFRHQTQALLRRLYVQKRWDMILAVAPDYAGLNSRAWPPYLPRLAQGSGDLGMRMLRILRHHPRSPVCLIGGDIPGITAHHIARAFGALGSNDMVFGPAEDGGFWLIGRKAGCTLPPRMFRDVRWSTEDALSDTIGNLPEKRIALIEELRDVDDASDLAWISAKRHVNRG